MPRSAAGEPTPHAGMVGPGTPARHPLAVLFLCSTAAAVAVAIIEVAVLAATTGVGLVRELEFFKEMLGEPGAPRLAFTGRIIAALPEVMNQQFALHTPHSLLAFVALAIGVTVLVFWVLAALAAPLILLAARLIRRGQTDTTFARWLWERAYPLGVLAVFALPAFLTVVHVPLWGAGATVIVATAVAVAAVVWIALVAALRDGARVARFTRACFVVALVAGGTIGGAAAVSALAAGVWRPQPPATPGQPNVLLVSIDSLRADHVHRYGYARETSPTIDQLAREGTRFATTVSPTSWTLPAHLTLLTSLPPEEHGAVGEAVSLRQGALFLTEVLWEAGYTTVGFVSAPYLDSAYGFSQGFDHYDDYTIAKRSFDASEHGTTSPALLRIVSEWLQRWQAGGRQRPFFIFMHMWDVHYDYTPPPPYDSMFDPDYHGTVTGENYWNSTQVHKGMDPRDLEHIIALYDGEIRFTDLHLGYVLDELRKLGVLDQTIVVVTADHGDEFFEHGRKGHKQALYDESILVPLVIRFPGKVPAGRVVEDQVRLMDISPTIIALAGLPLRPDFGPTEIHGPQAPQNLIPWMTADSTAALPALPAFSDLVGEAPVPIAALRTHSSKFIKQQRGKGNEELYDLLDDPGEQANLLRDGHPVDTPLPQQLASWRGRWAGGTRLAQAVTLGDAHKERLRALGYAQ